MDATGNRIRVSGRWATLLLAVWVTATAGASGQEFPVLRDDIPERLHLHGLNERSLSWSVEGDELKVSFAIVTVPAEVRLRYRIRPSGAPRARIVGSGVEQPTFSPLAACSSWLDPRVLYLSGRDPAGEPVLQKWRFADAPESDHIARIEVNSTFVPPTIEKTSISVSTKLGFLRDIAPGLIRSGDQAVEQLLGIEHATGSVIAIDLQTGESTVRIDGEALPHRFRTIFTILHSDPGIGMCTQLLCKPRDAEFGGWLRSVAKYPTLDPGRCIYYDADQDGQYDGDFYIPNDELSKHRLYTTGEWTILGSERASVQDRERDRDRNPERDHE